MNAFDQFDLVDTRIAGAIEDLAAASRPDYIDDVLQVTAENRQRPRWAFPERWLPVDTTMQRPVVVRRLSPRLLVVAALLLILIVGAVAFYAGSQPRVPAPFGPAANGALLYTSNGDLYVRDAMTSTGHLVLGGEGSQNSPAWSPDGEWFSFATTLGDTDHFSVARADGSQAHEIALIPATGNAQATWRPDSRAIALVYDVDKVPTLKIAPVDAPARTIPLGGLVPYEVAYRPPNGAELLVRVKQLDGNVGFVVIGRDDHIVRTIPMKGGLIFGPDQDNGGAAWSPDGARIAYHQVISNPTAAVVGTFRVHIMNADGTGDRAMPGPTDLAIQEAWPQFSPDGKSILVDRWTWNGETTQGDGWLAVMPSDGSAPARDIGPRVKGGQDTGLIKLWSPDGTRVIVRSANRRAVYSIDPVTGEYESIPWTTDLPDWQRITR